MNRAPGLVDTYGNVISTTEPPSVTTKNVRTGAKYGSSIVGTAIDFGVQVITGENVVDASIKAVSHTAIGATGAKIGAVIGSAIPVLGSFVGGAIGYSIAVVGSAAFDFVYNNKDKVWSEVREFSDNTIEKVKDTSKKIGEAVTGFFGNLGTVFG